MVFGGGDGLGHPFWAQAAAGRADTGPRSSAGSLWLLVGFFGIFPGIVAYMVWLERKVAARFQDRIGPNRVGPLGLLQPIADAIKLITKEDIVPRDADRWVHLAAPVLVIVSAFLVLAVIPFAVGLAPVDLPSGMVYLIAVSSLSPLGIFLAGWSSRNKYSLLGAMRAVAQLVSYEVPQVLSTIPIVLWAGSLSLVTIFNRQLEFGWFIFSPPGFLAFVILLIASIAEVNRTPFDLPEAESEIIAGYHTEYSGDAVRPVLPGRIPERLRRELPGDGPLPGRGHADPVRRLSRPTSSARTRRSRWSWST